MDQSELVLEGGASRRKDFLYYHCDRLEAIRLGRYKLHFYKEGRPVSMLYDLEADIGETDDLYERLPEVVKELTAAAAEHARVLGDVVSGISGSAVRPCGRVAEPRTLTALDPEHPYIDAMYDCSDFG